MSDMEDAGVLVMNFSDDEDNFPAPMVIKPEENFINNCSNQLNEASDHTHSIKLEGYGICLEETKESIFKEFDASAPEEEYILGAEATAEILAIARIENSAPIEVQTQQDVVTITLDSDSDDDGISSSSDSNIPLQNVDNSTKTYDNLNESNLSQDFSSIVITNVESVVDGSENFSLLQVEESAASKENSKSCKLKSVETNELQLDRPTNCPKQLFKCKICDFSSKTRFSLSRHKRCHVDDNIQSKGESTSENIILSRSDVCSLGANVNSNEKCNKNNSLCQPNDSVDSSFKCNGESTSTVPQLNICPVETSNKSKEDSASENNTILPMSSDICSAPASLKIPKTCLFKCKLCSFSSKIRFALQRHISLNHADIPKKTEPSTDEKIKSISQHRHQCTYCLFVAKNNVGLANHIRIKHNKIEGECSSCHKILKHQFMRQHKLTCNKVKKGSKRRGRPLSTAIGIAKKRKTSDVAFSMKTNNKNNLKKKTIEKGLSTAGPSVQSNTSNTARRYQCGYCSFTSKFDHSIIQHEYLHTKYNRPIYYCKECNYKSTKFALHMHIKRSHKALKPIPIKKSVKISGLVRTTSVENAKQSQDTNITLKNGQSDTLAKHLKKKTIEKGLSTAGPSVQSNTSNSAPSYQCGYCSFTSKFDHSIIQHEYLHTKYNRPIYYCKECNYKSTKCALHMHIKRSHKALKPIPIKKSVKISGLVRTKSVENAKQSQDTNITLKNGQSDTLAKHLNPTKKNVPKDMLKTCMVKGIDKQATKAVVTSVSHEASKKFNKNPSLSKVKRVKSLKMFQCPHCPHISKSNANFDIHLVMHTKSKMPLYSCKECNYISTKGPLTRHIRTAHRELSNNITSNNIRVSQEVKLRQGNIKGKRDGERMIADSSTVTGSCAEISNRMPVKETGSTLTRNISDVKLKDGIPKLSGQKRHSFSDLDSSSVLYVCEICAYETNNKETLIFHKLTHAGTTVTTDSKLLCLDLNYEKHATDQLTNNILPKPEKHVSQNITEAEERKRQCVSLNNDRKQCSVCERIFVNRSGFLKHRCENLSVFFNLVKREGTKFTCKECLFSSDSWLRLKQHLLVHKSFEEAAIYKCLMCDFRTKYKSYLGTHMGRVHEKKDPRQNYKYNCDICNYKTNLHRSIRSHKISCHKEPIVCDICGYKTLLPTVMINHKMSAHKLQEKKDEEAGMGANENIKYKCDRCDFQTNYKNNLQSHKILHININELRVYKNKTFNVKLNHDSNGTSSFEKGNNDITKPKAAKSSPPPFATSPLYHCNYCTYNTPVKATLYAHRYMKHSKGKKSDTKNKTNSHGESENLTKSSKTMSGINFSCRYCAYTTKFRFNLKRHIEKLHNKNKKVIKHVGLSKDRTLINNSSKTFENEFYCSSCPFSTKYKHSCQRHVRSDHGENNAVVKSRKLPVELKVGTKPRLKCSSYATTEKDRLKIHFKTHITESKDITVNPALSVNAALSTNTNIFKCRSCFYTSKVKCNLDRHFNACHVQK